MTIKVVHTADLHLGKSFNFTRYFQGFKRSMDLLVAFSQIVEFAIKNKADIFLLSGDVFDKVNPSNETRVYFIRELKRLYDNGIICFAIAGNHDFPKAVARGETVLNEVEAAGLCHVFGDPEAIEKKTIKIRGFDVNVYGKPFNPLQETASPLENFTIKLGSGINIMMLHGAFVNGKPRGLEELPYQMQQHPIFESQLPKNLSYLALGHLHRPTIIETKEGAIVGNPGSPETLDRTEIEYGNSFIWAEFTQSSCKAKHISIKGRECKIFTYELKPEIDEVTTDINHFLEHNKSKEAIAWIDLTGKISEVQYRNFDMQQIINTADNYFFAYVFDRTQLQHEKYGKIFDKYKLTSPLQAVRDYVERKMKNLSKSQQELYLKALEKATKYFGDGA